MEPIGAGYFLILAIALFLIFYFRAKNEEASALTKKIYHYLRLVVLGGLLWLPYAMYNVYSFQDTYEWNQIENLTIQALGEKAKNKNISLCPWNFKTLRYSNPTVIEYYFDISVSSEISTSYYYIEATHRQGKIQISSPILRDYFSLPFLN